MEYPKASFLASCIVIAASSVSFPVLAQDAAPPPPDGAVQGPRLATQTPAVASGPSPITLRLLYTGEAAYNTIGGIHDGGTYMNQILGQLHVDTGKAFGWTGGSFALEAFYENADSLSRQYVGAVQDPSVIDTFGVAMFRIYQA